MGHNKIVQRNPKPKDDEVIERIKKIKDADIDPRDKRTATAILIRKNSVSRTMQESNKANKSDIDHICPIRKQLDDIFEGNMPIEEVIGKSHDLQRENTATNRGKSNKKESAVAEASFEIHKRSQEEMPTTGLDTDETPVKAGYVGL